MNAHRLFDADQLAVLATAKAVLADGMATLKGRTPLFPTERTQRNAEEARQGREALTMYMQLQVGSLPHEQSLLALFDPQGRLIDIEALPEGDLTSCPVPARLIAGHAIRHGAAMCLMVHNHPSGTCSPSKQDVTLFENLRGWLGAMDCLLIDSLVLTVDDWCAIGGDWTC